MELRCGIDIVSVDRVARLWRELPPDKVRQLFGPEEVESLRGLRFPERHLAERFAAQEACLKLFPLETASGDLSVEDIRVSNGVGRSLHLLPGERLRRAMDRHGVADIALSAASSRLEACALAVVAARTAPALTLEEEIERAAREVRNVPPSRLGKWIYRLFPIRRRVILANMRRVFGARLGAEEYRRLAEAFYAHMARFLIDAAAYTFRRPDRETRKVRVENMEVPRRAARARRGLLILTGHFGSWESACAWGSEEFPQFRGRFHFIRRPISTRWVERLVQRRFERAGLKVIPKRNSLFTILELLEENHILVFIHDQHASVPKDGVVVEFFGQPAGTFRSLALIAKASGAPVVPACGWREPDGTHVLRFEEPVPWIHCQDPDEEVCANTRAYNRALESMVLRHPEQWFWMHKRWKL